MHHAESLPLLVQYRGRVCHQGRFLRAVICSTALLVQACLVCRAAALPVQALAPTVCRYSDMEERLDIMEALLRWRHLAPTAPDTLPAIPLSEADPFILSAAPAVFFAGCQPAYGTRLITGAGFDDVLLCLASCL